MIINGNVEYWFPYKVDAVVKLNKSFQNVHTVLAIDCNLGQLDACESGLPQ